VVEMHGGQVAAASDGPGQGTTFTVRLPPGAVETESETEESRPESPSRPIDLAGRNILVVDDDGHTRELLQAMLSKSGGVVTTAASAEEAVRAIDAHVPDLLVADIGMPVEDGLTLCRRVRARRADQGGKVPAVALSAYTRSEDRAAALGAGFDAFVAKPATPSALLSVIGEVLERAAHHSESPRPTT
jgi:CheY-like chemotaxis protein